MSGYVILMFIEKMATLFANSGDPDQTPHSVASDLDLYCLLITFLRDSRQKWVKYVSWILNTYSRSRLTMGTLQHSICCGLNNECFLSSSAALCL